MVSQMEVGMIEQSSIERMWIDFKIVQMQDPKQIVSCIDFRYITDALTEEEALGETGS